MPEAHTPKGLTDLLGTLGGTLVELVQAEARGVLSDAVTEAQELLAEARGVNETAPTSASSTAGKASTNGSGLSDPWLHTTVRAAIEEVAPYLTMDVAEAIADAAVERAASLRAG